MPHALLVSHFFPPRFNVGGKRFHRFARYLPEHGYTVSVITAAAPPGERLDPSLDVSCPVFAEIPTPAEVAAMPPREYGSDGTLEAPTAPWTPAPEWRSLKQRLRAELRSVPLVGPGLDRVPAYAWRIARRARDVGADIIYATGAPWETIVAAALGAQAARLPLVVDFRDPWTFGLFQGRRPAWARAVDRRLERLVFRSASALTVTAEATRARYRPLAAPTSVETILTGYDPEIRPAPVRSDAVTLIHFGNCYAGRTLAPFLRALARAVLVRRLDPGEIRLVNLGRVAASDLALAAELGISAYFEHTTVVPYREGIDRLAGADLALLTGYAEVPWFLPGKLFDYALARVPVLAATRAPEIVRILDHTGLGFAHDAAAVEALSGRIVDAVEARRSGRRIAEPDEPRIEALSARATTGQVARVLDAALRGRGHGGPR